MFKPNYNENSPPTTSVIVDASTQWYEAAGDDMMSIVQNLITQYAGVIHSFYQGQNQDYVNSKGTFWGKSYTLGPITVKYTAINDQKRLDLLVRPENALGGGLPDRELNLDGYIAWYFTGDPGGVQYDFELNGVSLYSCTSPAQNSVILFEFGTTAAKCQSLADKGSKDFPLAPGNPNKGLAMPVLPPRSRTKKFETQPNQGYFIEHTINTHDDLPLYPMYYYGNYLAQGDGYGSTTPVNGDVHLALGEPTIAKNVTVNLDKLNEKALNKFRVRVSPPKFLPLKGGGAIVFAEFYSRKDGFRAVNQSWTKQNQLGIQVNDEPLYFAMSVPYYKTQALDFDLSLSKVDRTTPTPYPAFWNPNTLQEILTDSAYANGYWRPGDGVNVQNPPDGTGPWYWAVKGARQAVLGWQYATTTMLLFRIEDEYISGEYYWAFPATEQAYNAADESLKTADDTVTTALSAYDDDDVYGDNGATASMANSIAQVTDAYNSIDTTSPFVTSLAGYQIDDPDQFDDEFVTTQRKSANTQIQALDDDLVGLLKNINSYPKL